MLLECTVAVTGLQLAPTGDRTTTESKWTAFSGATVHERAGDGGGTGEGDGDGSGGGGGGRVGNAVGGGGEQHQKGTMVIVIAYKEWEEGKLLEFWRTVRVFDMNLHSRMPLVPTPATLEASTRVTNGIPLGCSLLSSVDTVNCMQTLKAHQPARWMLVP
jgi:hypothetical protein